MKRLLSIVVVTFCVILILPACRNILERSKPRAYSNSLKTPEEVVKVFCDMDAAGKRLSSSTWSELLPYIDWKDEAMESVAVVISGFKVLGVERGDNVAEINVTYDVIGEYNLDKLVPTKSIEKVLFTVIKTDNGWKISSPDTMVPHVSAKPLIIHLERIIKMESDSSAVKEIQDRIHTLESLK